MRVSSLPIELFPGFAYYLAARSCFQACLLQKSQLSCWIFIYNVSLAAAPKAESN